MIGHTIKTEKSERHVVVRVDETVLADSHDAVMLEETGLPTRWYIPPHDVRFDALTSSETRTTCPFKGVASYYSAEGHPDVAWTYAEPKADREDISGYVSFLGDGVLTTVD